MTVDVRPRWQRWADPRRRPALIALSIAWFVVGLAGEIAALAVYGARARPIDHAWHTAAWLTFSSWMIIGHYLHRRGRR